MNPLARRRTVAGAVTAASALLLGLVVAPAVTAAPNGLSISPNAVQNTTASRVLTYTGTDTDFAYGATVTFTMTGSVPFTANVPAPNPQVPVQNKQSSGMATVNFTDVGNGLGQDGPADAGVYNVQSQGNTSPFPAGAPGGGTDNCTSCFTVLSAGPVAVTSVTPNSLRPNTRGNVTIAGNNFERGTQVRFLNADGSVDSGITVAAPTENNTDTGAVQTAGITTRTELKRRLSVASGTAPGARDVQVFNVDGSSATCAACFFVAGQDLMTVSPTGEFNDTTGLTRLTFSGPNVTDGQPSLEFVGTPGGSSRSALSIPGTPVAPSNGTSITADFDLRNAAPQANAYQPFVRDGAGVVNACTCRFTVLQRDSRTPTVTSLDSDTSTAGMQREIRQGTTVDFVVNGTNFSKGAAVVVSGMGVTVTSVEFLTPESLLAKLTASGTATTGPRDVSVTLTDGKTSPVCTGCLTVASGASPTSSSTATRSATATATMSPRPPACPTGGLTVRVNTRTINATALASVTVSGASDTATVELQGYSQNHEGDVTFDNDPTPIDRVGRANEDGSVTFNDLRPASNTRLRARQQGCSFNNQSDVIEVRAQETLEVVRNGTRDYTFRGRSIPAREGGLIVSLYRITGAPCPAGVEPSKCSGEKFIGQGRAASLGARGEGLYSIRIRFPSADQNKRDEFVVKTGRDAQNAPGRSNVRTLLIN